MSVTEAGSTYRPLNSLIASARRLTTKSMGVRAGSTAQSWQDDAWDMFDLVGEQRFLAVTLAGRMGQARFYVGKLAQDAQDAPDAVDDEQLNAILESIGASPVARQQMVTRLGINLFIAGDGWLVGIPRHLIPETLLVGGSLSVNPDAPPVEPPEGYEPGSLSIDDLEWRMLSVSEVSATTGGNEVQVRLGPTEDETIRTSPNNLFLIRVWRPHPRRWWEADSPTRSSLPVLRELVGLTMHVSAQVDSRLAGAGLLIVPQSAQRALQIAAGVSETDPDEADQFTPALMEAMLTPISDRANASALVPLVVTVPDEAVEKFKHITFDKPLDTTAMSLRDEAIRRLALGEDAPPELLLGTAGMNHWGAWLVQEDVVTTHLEPPLALICDALTTQFLWPVLGDMGYSEAEAQQYVIWYDVSDLVVRPNRGTDAQALHAKGAISDEALRAATGFDESDAPPRLAPELEIALAACAANPALLGSPGIGVIVEQLRAVLNGEIPPSPPGAVDPVEQGLGPAQPPATAKSGQPTPEGSGGQSIPSPVPQTRDANPAPATAASAAPATIAFGIPMDDLVATRQAFDALAEEGLKRLPPSDLERMALQARAGLRNEG